MTTICRRVPLPAMSVSAPFAGAAALLAADKAGRNRNTQPRGVPL